LYLDILIDRLGHVKIADFGTSALISDNQSPRTSFVGTQDYVSPEVLSGERKATKASDLWAVGIMIYQMLTGISPFREPTEYLTFESIMGHCRRTKPLQYPPAITAAAQDLIENLLKSNEWERIGSGEEDDSENGYPKLKNHAFFDGIMWDDLINRLPPFQPDPTKFPDPNNMRDGAEEAWLLEGEATPITHYTPQEELTKSHDNPPVEVSEANKIWNRFLLDGENQVFTSTIWKRKVSTSIQFCFLIFHSLLIILYFFLGFILKETSINFN
jgi:serine/threonine protein kinase